ncbi:hypothetical protein AAFC00_000333 [Neodothiora populina]|uniref:NAD-dependent epimerase/dehydratase domain-containing protein n=1 Tax=Neodothiora populina TaxID=2781224 RepID=A0ABR3PCL8_9PEZI
MTPPSVRIFATGASGYIGSTVTRLAISGGYVVHALSRSEAADAKLLSLGAVPVRGDLSSLEVLTREAAAADIVIHLADSLTDDHTADFSIVLKTDAAAVDAIAKGLEGSKKLFIGTSGSLVTAPDPDGAVTTETSPLQQDPLNGRIESEKHILSLRDKGIRVCVVRLAPFVYGRGGSGVRLLMNVSLPAGQVMYVDDGCLHTSTVHVDDAARLYLLIARSGTADGAYNATTGHHPTFRQLGEAMAATLGVPAVGIPFDIAASGVGTFFARFLSAENKASSARAMEELGWLPKEVGILEDIRGGSYAELAQKLKAGSAA